MAMVNMNNLLNGKDSRWLQLEVCREFQRQKCSRPDTECKFAHPPANVEVQNGRVTACYDSIKGRCNREKPPCKYFHPPQHLKDQLLINGRNHLALKNALMQQMGLGPGQPLVPGQVPTVEGQTPAPSHQHLQQQIQQQLLATHALMATNPYLTGMPQVGNTYSPYFAASPMMPTIMGPTDPTGVGSPLGVVQQTVAMPQKMPRSDRLEVCREFQRGACKRGETECRFAHPLETVQANEDGSVTVCMDAVKGRCNREPCRYFHPPLHLQAHIKATQSRASIATAAALPMTGAVSANAVPGGLQNANMASIELGKKRMRDSNDDLLMMDMKSVGSLYYDNFAFQGMVPYKRPAGEKSGVPVYQPTGATTYQQLMQLQQPFVPVSCEYSGTPPLPAASSNPSVATAIGAQSISTSAAIANSISSSNSTNGSSNNSSTGGQLSNSSGTGGAVGSSEVSAACTNGILVDPNHPPPPPPPPLPPTSSSGSSAGGATSADKLSGSGSDSSESLSASALLQNSHDSNHSGSIPTSSVVSSAVAAAQHQQHQHQIQQALNAASNPLTSMYNSVVISSVNSSLNSVAGMNYTMAGMGGLGGMLGNHHHHPHHTHHQGLSLDAASLAKEVAQKNYAKALKFSQQAAISQQAAAAAYGLSPLNALSYTGVALNKQSLAAASLAQHQQHQQQQVQLLAQQQQQAQQTGAGGHRSVIGGLPGLPAGLLAYRAAASQQAAAAAAAAAAAGNHQVHHHPQQLAAHHLNPYSLVRQQVLPGTAYVQAAAAAMPAQAHYMQSPYAAMIPGGMQPLTAGAAAGMAGQPGVAAAAAAAAHAAATAANSGVIMQPYKKMKTT